MIKNNTTYPLSNAQLDVFFHQQSFINAPTYNIGGYLTFVGDFCPDTFAQAHELLVGESEAFNIRIEISEYEPVQFVSEGEGGQLEVIDFSSELNAEVCAKDFVQKQIEAPFNLEGNRLFRAFLIKVESRQYWYLLIGHHLIMDGWCYSLAKKRLSESYNKLLKCRRVAVELNEDRASFLEETLQDKKYLESKAYHSDRKYWRDVYSYSPDRILPPRYRYKYAKEKAAPSGHIERPIGADEFDSIRALSQDLNTTPAQVIIAICCIYFSRIRNSNAVVVGVPSHNRRNAKRKKVLGMFSSLTPMRFDIDLRLSFSSTVAAVSKQLRSHMKHQRYPASHLKRELDFTPEDRSELYDICVNYLPFDYDVEFLGVTTRSIHLNNGYSQTPLNIFVKDFGRAQDGTIELDYNYSYWTDEEASLLLARLLYMLDQMKRDPSICGNRIDILPNSEKEKLLVSFNNTTVSYFHQEHLTRIFCRNVEEFADKPAVIFEGNTLSLKELDRVSDRLAAILTENGTKPGDIVILSLERSLELVVSLLAILKIGSVYLPVEPCTPQKRKSIILEDSKPRCIVGDISGWNRECTEANDIVWVKSEEVKKLIVSAEKHEEVKQAGHNNFSPNALIYAMYTSGSTGKPKAVLIEHKALINQLEWMRSEYKVDSHDVILHKTPLSFDVSVWELMLPLYTGATLVVAKPGGHRDSRYLCDLIKKHQITLIDFVPSLFKEVVAEAGWKDCSSLKAVLSGGEVLPPGLVREHYAKNPARLDNAYGPTEATITASSWECPRGFGLRPDQPLLPIVPIGRPIQNIQFYVTDEGDDLLPIGEVGVLCIGGDGLARGYLNREALNREKFCDLQLPGGEQKRVYRTGDRVRWLADGSVEYLSRDDGQVKLRGQRIEVGEVEAVIAQQPSVDSAVVVFHTFSTGETGLVAYVVPAEAQFSSNEIFLAELRSELISVLPSYMIPVSIMALDDLPLTSAGKVNRKNLPLPSFNQQKVQYVAPRNDIEHRLVELWQNILQCENIGIYDDFFLLGGNSLTATRMVSQASRALDLNIPLNVIFEKSRLEVFSQDIAYRIHHSKSDLYLPRPIESYPDELYLSPNQRVSFNTPDENRNLFIAYSLIKEVISAPKLLRESLVDLVARHDALRLRSKFSDGQWKQHIDDNGCFEFQFHDLAEYDNSEQIDFMKTQCIAISQCLDIEQGPLLAVSSFRLSSDNTCYIFFVIHHLVCDTLSSQIIYDEIINIYENKVNGIKKELFPPFSNYRDYCEMWRRYSVSERYREGINKIQANNGNIEKTIISADFDVPFRGRDGKGRYFRVQYKDQAFDDLSVKIQEAVVLYSLVQVFASRYSEKKMGVWLTRNARGAAIENYDFSRTVGWFTSQIPVWIGLTQEEKTCDAIERVMQEVGTNEQLLHAYALMRACETGVSEDSGYEINWPEIVLNHLGDAPSESRDAFFYDRSELLNSLEISSKDVVNDHKMYIMVEVSKDSREIEFDWQYSAAQFYEETMDYIIEEFIGHLNESIREISVRKNQLKSAMS